MLCSFKVIFLLFFFFLNKSKQVNTDGLVLRGWYNCLTLAIYGSVDRVITHDRESPPPPPPPPPPPQQQPGLKRTPKHGKP